jgi:hypothetical protein
MNTHLSNGRRASRVPASARTLVCTLGWLSIGLGVVELLAARRLARGAGLPHDVAIARMAGVRGVAAGIGILAGKPGVHIGARVAGDMLDLATLALPARRPDAGPMRRRYPALAVTAAVTGFDLYAGYALYRGGRRARKSQQRANDYRLRSGFSRPASEMRGAARDFQAPREFRTPELLRPFGATAAQ